MMYYLGRKIRMVNLRRIWYSKNSLNPFENIMVHTYPKSALTKVRGKDNMSRSMNNERNCEYQKIEVTKNPILEIAATTLCVMGVFVLNDIHQILSEKAGKKKPLASEWLKKQKEKKTETEDHEEDLSFEDFLEEPVEQPSPKPAPEHLENLSNAGPIS